jgi:DHA1 family multidrug resistance protein-like MFS transporter
MAKSDNTRNASIIYFISFIGFFSIFSTTISKSPVLPLFVKGLGGNDSIIGLISAISPIAGIILSFPVGMLSDKIGLKKMLYFAGLIFLIAPLLYFFVNNPLLLIPIRFFHGIATAILGPVSSVMIFNAFPKSKGEKLGVYSSATLFGRALAPLVGGFIISLFTAISDVMVFRYVYAFAFILGIITFILILSMKYEDTNYSGTTHSQSPSYSDFTKSLKSFLQNRILLSTALVEMATYFAFGSFETFLPIYLSSIGYPTYLIGMIFSVQILSIAFSKPLFGRISDSTDRRLQIVAGILLLGICIVALPFVSALIPVFGLSFLFGIGVSSSTVSTSAYVSDIAEKDEQGASIGALSSIMDIGHSAGPFLTGIIITYSSISFGFFASFVLCIIVAMTFLCCTTRNNV